jgi:hypothetical protein
LNTLPGKCLRTSSATSLESRVLLSNMVSTTPRTSSPGFSILATRPSVFRSCVSPSSA